MRHPDYVALVENLTDFDQAAYLVISDWCRERGEDVLADAWREMAGNKHWPVWVWGGLFRGWNWYSARPDHPATIKRLQRQEDSMSWAEWYKAHGTAALALMALADQLAETPAEVASGN